MILFTRSPYKAKGNPTSKGTNKNELNKSDEARGMYILTSFFYLQSSCNECFDFAIMHRLNVH
jgi:hypothetical protein